MISPIKFNSSYLSNFFKRIFPNENDPRNLLEGEKLSSNEFSKHIEGIYFGGKFSKTTKPERHIFIKSSYPGNSK